MSSREVTQRLLPCKWRTSKADQMASKVKGSNLQRSVRCGGMLVCMILTVIDDGCSPAFSREVLSKAFSLHTLVLASFCGDSVLTNSSQSGSN